MNMALGTFGVFLDTIDNKVELAIGTGLAVTFWVFESSRTQCRSYLDWL